MDLLTLPLDRFLNRVMAWARSLLGPSDWRKFSYDVERPPIGEEPRSGPWSEEAIAATWERNA